MLLISLRKEEIVILTCHAMSSTSTEAASTMALIQSIQSTGGCITEIGSFILNYYNLTSNLIISAVTDTVGFEALFDLFCAV